MIKSVRRIVINTLRQPIRMFKRPVLTLAHYIFYSDGAWNRTWMGVPVFKLPFDLWTYQELVYERKPTLIIESGTYSGGSALYFAHLMDIMNSSGRIISIDIEPNSGFPQHPRIEYRTASSTAPETLAWVRSKILPDDRVMVVLDSDHRCAHVQRELELYSPLVTPGQYLICEDTDVNGHPVNLAHGPGPMEALDAWLPSHPEFTSDAARESMVTFFHRGWLLRQADNKR
jgi:cephalosporin hydroxylase